MKEKEREIKNVDCRLIKVMGRGSTCSSFCCSIIDGSTNSKRKDSPPPFFPFTKVFSNAGRGFSSFCRLLLWDLWNGFCTPLDESFQKETSFSFLPPRLLACQCEIRKKVKICIQSPSILFSLFEIRRNRNSQFEYAKGGGAAIHIGRRRGEEKLQMELHHKQEKKWVEGKFEGNEEEGTKTNGNFTRRLFVN